MRLGWWWTLGIVERNSSLFLGIYDQNLFGI